ncbi:MAG: hypothetical protein KF884_08665 [Fimbriimonadaceae bacterium]|nr:hypothetical protein [Fimbriimonadaceae bacterium]QYK57621.1 MAG: hypothetical protein KF884_08665 [Fimbriimonadaceae bacterium]
MARRLLRVTLELQSSVESDRIEELGPLLMLRSQVLSELESLPRTSAVRAVLDEVATLEARVLTSWTSMMRGAPVSSTAIKAYAHEKTPVSLDRAS